MIICPVCNKSLPDDASFCNDCGTRLFDALRCQVCGQPITADAAFCASCGAPTSAQPQETEILQQPQEAELFQAPPAEPVYAPAEPVYAPTEPVFASEEPVFAPAEPAPSYIPPEIPTDAPVKEKKNILKKIPKKAVIAAAAALILIIAAALLVSLFGKGKAQNNYALYIKDDELFFTQPSKYAPFQVSSKLFSDSDDADYQSIGNACVLSQDGKTIFFPDKIDSDEDGFTLFYRSVSDSKKEATKIASNLAGYFVSEDASTVVYLTKDYNLYQYSVKKDEKEKIGSDVSNVSTSKDGKTVYYTDADDTLYIKQIGKDKEKIDSDASIQKVSTDCSTVYYFKEGDLYKKTVGKDKVKIDSDVTDLIAVYDSGELYYVKSDSKDVPLSDYVTDDFKNADAAISEPESPSWWDYDTDEEYDAAYEKYEKAYEQYSAKRARDALRQKLADETVTVTDRTLYYYDGKSEKVVSESYGYYRSVAKDKPVIAYTSYNSKTVDKVKLSEVESISDLKEAVNDALYSTYNANVATGGEVNAIEQEDACCFRISDDGSTVLYVCDVTDDEYGDLYKAAISGGKLKKAEKYDTDVSTEFCACLENGDVVYCKDYKSGSGDLYINKEKIDTDIYISSLNYIADAKSYYYYTDYDGKAETGTLKSYSNGKSVKISDDVYRFVALPNGDVLYLYDYSTKRSKGDLYVFSGKKAQKLDEDVSWIFYPKTNENSYVGRM